MQSRDAAKCAARSQRSINTVSVPRHELVGKGRVRRAVGSRLRAESPFSPAIFKRSIVRAVVAGDRRDSAREKSRGRRGVDKYYCNCRGARTTW